MAAGHLGRRAGGACACAAAAAGESRADRVDTVAIEGNPLSLTQATAVLEGKRVRGAPRQILEIQNANQAYEQVART